MNRKSAAIPCIALALLRARAASAQDPAESQPSPESVEPSSAQTAATRDARREVPVFAYAYGLGDNGPGTWGMRAYASQLAASGQSPTVGGGGSMWGTPFERVNVIVDAQRTLLREFSPSAAAIVRLYGNGREGLSLGALGKFKIDGFGKGPSGDEVESEIELGGLMSWAASVWHLDVNLIGGRGMGDDGEMDGEGRLRLGRDLGAWGRVGLDGQARVRMAGPLVLPNGRSWDFAAGPQIAAFFGSSYASVTTSATTMGLVTRNVGMTAMLSLGAGY